MLAAFYADALCSLLELALGMTMVSYYFRLKLTIAQPTNFKLISFLGKIQIDFQKTSITWKP